MQHHLPLRVHLGRRVQARQVAAPRDARRLGVRVAESGVVVGERAREAGDPWRERGRGGRRWRHDRRRRWRDSADLARVRQRARAVVIVPSGNPSGMPPGTQLLFWVVALPQLRGAPLRQGVEPKLRAIRPAPQRRDGRATQTDPRGVAVDVEHHLPLRVHLGRRVQARQVAAHCDARRLGVRVAEPGVVVGERAREAGCRGGG